VRRNELIAKRTFFLIFFFFLFFFFFSSVHHTGLSSPLSGLGGYFILNNESPYEIVTYNSDPFLVGKQVRLVAYSQHEGTLHSLNTPIAAQAQVVFPDGSRSDILMGDGGLFGDVLAGDGVYTGLLSVRNSSSKKGKKAH
jgi:hypothetical protein